jgi:Methylene-tetrahydrofolate reductase C terminal
MYAVRLWSSRTSRVLERFYDAMEPVFVALHPVLKRIGYQRLEKPIALLERSVKGLLFDCQMCGQCVLSRTGMTCPMNCPKQIRNGPCGGVRVGGFCEVKPEMRCVWVEAYHGSARMRKSELIKDVCLPVDRRLAGTSSWLRVLRAKAEAKS